MRCLHRRSCAFGRRMRGSQEAMRAAHNPTLSSNFCLSFRPYSGSAKMRPPERWMSGLSRTPGKRVYVAIRTVGSNPTLSAKQKSGAPEAVAFFMAEKLRLSSTWTNPSVRQLNARPIRRMYLSWTSALSFISNHASARSLALCRAQDGVDRRGNARLLTQSHSLRHRLIARKTRCSDRRPFNVGVDFRCASRIHQCPNGIPDEADPRGRSFAPGGGADVVVARLLGQKTRRSLQTASSDRQSWRRDDRTSDGRGRESLAGRLYTATGHERTRYQSELLSNPSL